MELLSVVDVGGSPVIAVLEDFAAAKQQRQV